MSNKFQFQIYTFFSVAPPKKSEISQSQLMFISSHRLRSFLFHIFFLLTNKDFYECLQMNWKLKSFWCLCMNLIRNFFEKALKEIQYIFSLSWIFLNNFFSISISFALMATNRRARVVTFEDEVPNCITQSFWCCRAKSRVAILILAVSLFTVAHAIYENRIEIIYLRNSVAKIIQELPTFANMEGYKYYFERAQQTIEKISNSNKIMKRTIFTIERPDLALRNSGGRVVGVGKDTKLFKPCNWYQKLLGCPNQPNAPQRLLETSMHPGECFGFYGITATIYIRLIGPAIVDSVAIEHISKEMSPTGNVSDAPRDFSVYVSHNNLFAKCTIKK